MRSFDRQKVPLPKIKKVEFNDGPVVVEIGAGVGLHPIMYSQEFPDHQVLAIERTRSKFEKFERRLNNHPHIKNCTAIHEDAISVITHLIGDAQVDRYFILYPNPYPKKNDQNKRFYAMPFMEEILRTLKADGEIILATNDLQYKKECIEFFKNDWHLELVEESLVTKGRTHFEKKYLLRNEPCYNLLFTRKSILSSTGPNNLA
ncbi:MAG: SAM-dependent methyltransferase [Bacteriovoracaceae bacterium]